MKVERFLDILPKIDFFTGVPDSKIKPFCNYLINKYHNTNDLIIAVNEGNAVAMAAGFYLATGKYPCVFMQNSGIGNIVNPVTSLTNENVFDIPIVYVIGWRGEPNKKDAPQHIKQGIITKELLTLLGIYSIEVDYKTTTDNLRSKVSRFNDILAMNKSVAILVKDNFFEPVDKPVLQKDYEVVREEVLDIILQSSGDDLVISTTGKSSREIFELREKNNEIHDRDLLVVGSMGHASGISLGVAMNTKKRVWIIDGDGSLLMHMGAAALIGSKENINLVHIIINNGIHESVGNYPTVANSIDLCQVAKGYGYKYIKMVSSLVDLKNTLDELQEKQGPIFLEVKVNAGSRVDLARPNYSPKENKKMFMNYIKGVDNR
jgi:phosphonopyruvate decarboxylase